MLFIAFFGGQPSRAQGTGTITGTVRSVDSAPVARARIALEGTPLTTTAESNGAFRLAAVPAGRHSLHISMIGFAPSSLPIDLRPGETLHVRIGLEALDPLPLAPVAVTAAIPAALRGFEERRAHGPGTFLQYEDIARLQPRQVTDILRRVSGLEIRSLSGPYGANPAVMQRGSRCPVMFFLNGSPFPISEIPINNFVTADDLMAIEVYNPSEIPPQFNSSAYGSRCGVVGLWTRSGNLPARSR